MKLKEALPMAEIMFGTRDWESERGKPVAAPPAGMIVALAPTLIPSRLSLENPESRIRKQIDTVLPCRTSERAVQASQWVDPGRKIRNPTPTVNSVNLDGSKI